MKKISAIIKGAVCVFSVVIMLSGCSQDDKLAQADANAKVTEVAVINILKSLYQQGTPPSGRLIMGQNYSIDIGDKTFNKADLEPYFGNDWNGYVFGEFNAETGSIEYILWSKDPIPSKYKTLLTMADQKLAAEEGVIIGCCPQYY